MRMPVPQTGSVCARELLNDPQNLELPETACFPLFCCSVQPMREPRRAGVPLLPALLLAVVCHGLVLAGALTLTLPDPQPGVVMGIDLLPMGGAASTGLGSGDAGRVASGTGPAQQKERARLDHAASRSQTAAGSHVADSTVPLAAAGTPASEPEDVPEPAAVQPPETAAEPVLAKVAPLPARQTPRNAAVRSGKRRSQAVHEHAGSEQPTSSHALSSSDAASTTEKSPAAPENVTNPSAASPVVASDLNAPGQPGVSSPVAATGSGNGLNNGLHSGLGGEDGPVAISFGDTDGPRFVHRILPKYPELARRSGREGLVVLRLVIGADGELKHVEVVQSEGNGFERAALQAVRASAYAPAMRSGRTVECSALLPIRFALKKS